MNLLFPLLLACGPTASLSPSQGLLSGYFPVEVALGRGLPVAEDIAFVSLGGQKAYDVEVVDETTLTLMVQGAPEPGWAELVLVDTAGVEVRVDDAFEYLAPTVGDAERFVSFGASLTQGVQSGVPTTEGGLVSPSAQVARHLGFYHPLPLLVPNLFPPIRTGDIGPVPDCAVPDVERHVSASAVEVIPLLSDPETGEFGFHNARIDPDIEIHNVGVGGFELADVVHGVEDNFALEFLAHLVLEPYGGLGEPILSSQLERVLALEPDIVMSPDLYGNDLIGAIVLGEHGVDPDLIPPLEEFEANMTLLLDTLEDSGAETFIATVPRPTLLPVTTERRLMMLEAGSTPDEVDAAVAAVEAMGLAYNAAFEALAATRPRVHVVDLAAGVAQLEEDGGLELDGQWLTLDKLGGLLSLDGIHFSDVGYALVAEQFVDAMNEAFGWDVPPMDMEAVLAGDPFSPESLREAGLQPELCEIPGA